MGILRRYSRLLSPVLAACEMWGSYKRALTGLALGLPASEACGVRGERVFVFRCD